MDLQELKAVAGQINTPAYVFNEAEFKKRASATGDILGADVKICYSIKANPFLLSVLPGDFSAVEVCSPGELSICMSLGVDPSMIIYSGLNKGTEDIALAINYGVRELTAESKLHLDMINSCAEKRGVTAKVLVRASAGSQFGIDRKSLPDILAYHQKYPNIEFTGLHFFTGTQKRKAKEIIKEVTFLKGYIEELRTVSGLTLPRIEYGTGLPAYMFRSDDCPSLDEAYTAELAMLEEIAPALQELAEISDLTVEMGRFFAASCGHYFSKVVDVKLNDGVDYAVIDGGSHQIKYFGQMQGMQIPFMDLISSDDLPEVAADYSWTVCGSLCTTADVLAREASFEGRPLRIGDTIAFHQTGAYSLYECMSLFLSRDLPGVYLLKDDGSLQLVRNRIASDIYNRPGGID